MGFRVEIAGRQLEATDFSYSEDSTPLDGDDTSGGVGSIQITLPYPNREFLVQESATYSTKERSALPEWCTPFQTNLWVKPQVEASDVAVRSVSGSVAMASPPSPAPSGRNQIAALTAPAGEQAIFEINPFGDFRRTPTVNSGPRPATVRLSPSDEVVITDNASVTTGVAGVLEDTGGGASVDVDVRFRDGFGTLTDPVWLGGSGNWATGGSFDLDGNGNYGEGWTSVPSEDRPLGNSFASILVRLYGGNSGATLYVDMVSLQYLGNEMFQQIWSPRGDREDTFYLRVFDGDVGWSRANSGLAVPGKFEWVSLRQNSPTLYSVGSNYQLDPAFVSAPGVGTDPYGQFGPEWLKGLPILILDTDRGYISGVIQDVSSDEATVTIDCATDLTRLVVNEVVAPAVSGDVETVLRTYVALSGSSLNVWVDPSVSDQQVTLGGWSGELWLGMKEFARSLECDLNFIGGTIVMRPIREVSVPTWRGIARSRSLGSEQVARGLEIYRYEYSTLGTDEVIFPVPGDPQSPPSIKAGQFETFTIQTSAFISGEFEINFPGFEAEGVRISTPSFEDRGGIIRYELNPDDHSQIFLTLYFPPNNALTTEDGIKYIDTIQMRDGMYVTASNGVSFQKFLHYIPSGLANNRTGSDVATTIDDPFVSSAEIMYRVGTRAAAKLVNEQFELSGEVDSVLSLGEDGIVRTTTYGQVQDEMLGAPYNVVQGQINPDPYNSVLEEPGVRPYESLEPLFDTYADDQDYWERIGVDPNAPIEFQKQTFGNSPGARIWDPESKRWYRIRKATSDRVTTTYQADDDVLYSDVKAVTKPGAVYGPTEAVTETRFLNFDTIFATNTLPGGQNVLASGLGISAHSGDRVCVPETTILDLQPILLGVGTSISSVSFFLYIPANGDFETSLSAGVNPNVDGVFVRINRERVEIFDRPVVNLSVPDISYTFDTPLSEGWAEVTLTAPDAFDTTWSFSVYQSSTGGGVGTIYFDAFPARPLSDWDWYFAWNSTAEVTAIDDATFFATSVAGPDESIEAVPYWNLTYEMDRRFALYER